MDKIASVLEEKGFSIDTTSSPAELPRSFAAAWPQQVLVQVSGPDAKRFLQGQVTCNLDELDDRHSLLGALCTPKGRTMVTFRALAPDDNTILLRMPGSLADGVMKHLDKYRVFFKAQMEILEDWAIIGIVGDSLVTRVAGETGTIQSPGDATSLDKAHLIATQPSPEGTPRFELWLPTDSVSLLDHFTADDIAPSSYWCYSEIQAGLVTLNPKTTEQFVPQHLNWHAVEGINFRKGCYTGQEVVARMRYLGQLKKSTVRFEMEGPAPQVNQGIVDQNGKSVGRIIDLQPLEGGRWALLAVTNHAALGKPLHPEDAEAAMHQRPIAYDVPEQQSSTA